LKRLFLIPQYLNSQFLNSGLSGLGITTLPGADIMAFEKIIGLLKKQEAGHISVTAGGFLDDEDIPRIRQMGVMAFFHRVTSFEEIVDWSLENIKPK
jgi:methylmalonyl-CoA mutase cobalamin-binding domain/chain